MATWRSLIAIILSISIGIPAAVVLLALLLETAFAMDVVIDGKTLHKNVQRIVVTQGAAPPPIDPPPIDPPPIDPPPSACTPSMPYRVEPLPTRLTRVNISGTRATAFKFKAEHFQKSGVIGFVGEPGPHGTPPSDRSAARVSLCPGDLSTTGLGQPGKACVAGGRDGAVRVRVTGQTGNTQCKLVAGQTYYFNIAAVAFSTFRPTCQGLCGVTLSSNVSQNR